MILASAGAHDWRMFNTGIDQKFFITESAYKIWDESVKNPAKYARFVLISYTAPRDMLNRKVNHQALERDFHVVREGDDFQILERNN